MNPSDPNDPYADLPEASVASDRKGLAPIWIVPLVALIAGAWMVYRNFSEVGPTVSIHFDSAEGIEAGKTRVKYLSVDLGLVTSVRFSEDGGVDVEAEMMPGSQSRLTDTARFWIVRPRLDATGVSGLGTLLSGAYIGMDPGPGGKSSRRFRALREPPRILSHQSGDIFTLWAEEGGSLSIGSPVYFRGIRVGSVVSHELSDDHSHVLVEVFVESPHNEFVRRDSRFWNVSGVQVETSAEGLQVQLESLAALASGGIAFDSPEGPGALGGIPEGHLFHLHQSRSESEEAPVLGTQPYLVYFNESVRGLSLDAPVEFRGIRVGAVRDILPATSANPDELRIGVLLGIEPSRMPFALNEELPAGWERQLDWVQNLAAAGARAQLKTGNLLTGQKYVDIDIYPAATPVEVASDQGYPVIPSIPGSLEGITDSLATILARLERVPLEQIGSNLDRATAGASRLVNSRELRDTVKHLGATTGELQALLAKFNAQADPLLENATRATAGLADLSADAGNAARQFEITLRALENTASEDGAIGNEALIALKELAAAARAIRAMAEYLERHPEALISGKQE